MRKQKNESLRAFLKYVQTNKAESELTRRLVNMVETQKTLEENKTTYLSWSLHDHDVRNEGIREGAERTALRMIKAGKFSTEEISEISGLKMEEIYSLKEENKTKSETCI